MSPEPRWWYEGGEPPEIRQGLRVRLLHAETTPFQQLEIYEHDLLGRILVLDGIVQATQADEFVYHEMIAHVPLLGGEAAQEPGDGVSVLIVGGGDGGALREVLRHDWVRRVEMVEVDEAVIRASSEYLGINGDYEDSRVELVVDDGAAYVSTPEVQNRRFDVIIVDSTDPGGPSQELFTEEFCRNLRACLTPRGVVVRQVGTPAYQPQVAREAWQQMSGIFGSAELYRVAVPTYVGGDLAFALAARNGASFHEPRRDYTGRYYNGALHRASFCLPTWWQEELTAVGGRPDPQD